MKNNFDNLRKLLPEALVMYARLDDWRYTDTDAETSYKTFKQYIKDNNKLVEKVVEALYKDTKEHNSRETLQSTMMAKNGSGELMEYGLKYPFEFITKTLELQYTLMMKGLTNYKSGYLPDIVREYNSRRERHTRLSGRDNWPNGELIHQGEIVAYFSYDGELWKDQSNKHKLEVIDNQLVEVQNESA